MRATARLLASTALAAAVTGLGVHTAYAWDSGTLEVFPNIAAPGAVITVSTTVCGPGGHGVGDARALGAGEFRLAPGTHKDVAVGQFTIPQHTHAGTYAITVSCKNGRQASGDVTVEHHGWPTGHVNTGVGGSVGPDTTQIAAGVAILAAAAVGGTVLLRRRASGAQGS
ncbi:hypothetical protein FBY35_5988 [Streptomyces sp. SLBN-118]|uniref:hypothetical protein n=1 Tax=Streptomyces sp. SLBN-118 TaxID=2768454 RepID=UPI00114E5056|nr:hypothetical protein [Streptomyces sp. SLBN-118]TQK44480.1 hypothetical protein FBY35_5988 [Streptomyces sp. SLBN-118]